MLGAPVILAPRRQRQEAHSLLCSKCEANLDWLQEILSQKIKKKKRARRWLGGLKCLLSLDLSTQVRLDPVARTCMIMSCEAGESSSLGATSPAHVPVIDKVGRET